MPSITEDDLVQFLPKMVESITRAEQFNVETGFTICEHPDGEYSTAGECTGSECSVALTTCVSPKKDVANFHTHPTGADVPSPSDRLYEMMARIAGYPERALRPDLIPSGMDTIFGILHDIDALCIGNRAGIVCYPFKDLKDMPEKGRRIYSTVKKALLRCSIAVQTGDQDTIAKCNVDLDYLLGHLSILDKDWFYDEEFWLK